MSFYFIFSDRYPQNFHDYLVIMRRFHFFVFLFFLTSSVTYANSDSLRLIFQNAKSIQDIDALNQGLLNVLESRYLPTDLQNIPTEYVQYAEKTLQLSESLKHKKGELNALLALGLYYWSKGLNYQTSVDQKCIDYFERASAIAKSVGDKEIDLKASRSLGKIYMELGEVQIGSKHILDTYQASKDNIAGKFYLATDVGNIYFDYGEYLKSLQKFLEALVIARREDNAHKIAYALNNVAKVFEKLARRSKAISNLEEGIAIAEKNKDIFTLALLYNTYGGINLRINEIDKANKYYEQALEMSKMMDNPRLNAVILQNLAKLYYKKKEYKKALDFYLQVLNFYEKSAPRMYLIDIYADLSDIYANNKDYQKSLHYFKLYTEINEKYFSDISQTELLKAEAQINEKKIEVLEKANKLSDSELNRQILQRNISFALAVVLLAGLSFLIFHYFQKQKANKELRLQKEELKQANTLKDRMFAVISQDLRNPLNSLRNVVTLLNADSLNQQEIKLISEKLNDDLGATLGLLDNLLYWARSQMQGIRKESVPINIAQVFNDNIALLSGSANKKGIVLQNTVSQTFNRAYADQNMIGLVVRNLLTNAIKFSPKGGTVIMGAKNNADMVEISVTDSGVGISYENQQKIFDSNIVLSNTGTAMEKGSGLGLLLCKEFIEENEGKIWVKSEEGKGSTFIFSLKIAS
ncbi:MAG: hypothetical protein EAZ08_09225 [Cytophagales bacterium]|nr:MAG: hypothetical protein EAZ08_09225 [Cytophagales bacterium]